MGTEGCSFANEKLCVLWKVMLTSIVGNCWGLYPEHQPQSDQIKWLTVCFIAELCVTESFADGFWVGQ